MKKKKEKKKKKHVTNVEYVRISLKVTSKFNML